MKTAQKITQVTPTAHIKNRLPCRGCTNTCVNYQHCEGKPWRTLNQHTRQYQGSACTDE